MKRRPIPPTNHLRVAIRKIDQVVWKLHDEQLAADGAYIEAVSRGDKREILKLYGAKFTALGDRAVMLERKMPAKERGGAIRLTQYEGEMASLYADAKRLRTRMESAYLHQKRFREGVLEKKEDNRRGSSKKEEAMVKPQRKRRRVAPSPRA